MIDTKPDSHSETAQRRNHLYELLEDFDTGMLVSSSPAGGFHAVPMHVADLDTQSHRLTFVTGDDTRKVEEVMSNPHVAVTFQSKTRYLSLSGRATVLRDPERVHELWNPTMKLWFDGPEDPRIALLIIDPRRGEYWDLSGTRGLRFLLRAGSALIQGESLHEDLDATHSEMPL